MGRHRGRNGSDVCHLLRDSPLHRAAKTPPADKLVAHALLPQKFFYISGIISLVLLGGIYPWLYRLRAHPLFRQANGHAAQPAGIQTVA